MDKPFKTFLNSWNDHWTVKSIGKSLIQNVTIVFTAFYRYKDGCVLFSPLQFPTFADRINLFQSYFVTCNAKVFDHRAIIKFQRWSCMYFPCHKYINDPYNNYAWLSNRWLFQWQNYKMRSCMFHLLPNWIIIKEMQ